MTCRQIKAAIERNDLKNQNISQYMVMTGGFTSKFDMDKFFTG